MRLFSAHQTLPGLFGLLLLWGAPAQAQQAPKPVKIQMEIFDAQSQGKCPTSATLVEQSQPYREGGYLIDGSADLSSIATGWKIATTDDFSVTWVGTLRPAFAQCRATAGMVKRGGENYSGHSYLRLRLVGGKAYLILDMTGMRDPNASTTVILKKDTRNGKPTWIWGGTD
jgi:hypothetical protein